MTSLSPLPKSTLLAGKTVVVTGASRGIGRACALQCAAHGADVVLHHFGDALSTREVAEMADEVAQLGRRSIAVAGVRILSFSWHARVSLAHKERRAFVDLDVVLAPSAPVWGARSGRCFRHRCCRRPFVAR